MKFDKENQFKRKKEEGVYFECGFKWNVISVIEGDRSVVVKIHFLNSICHHTKSISWNFFDHRSNQNINTVVTSADNT